MWERMAHIYAHRWTSKMGISAIDDKSELTPAAKTWATGLADVLSGEINNGLLACIDSGDEWPPSLPEFKKMCRGKSVDEFGIGYIPEQYRRQAATSVPALSSDERDRRRANGAKMIKKIASKLKGGKQVDI